MMDMVRDTPPQQMLLMIFQGVEVSAIDMDAGGDRRLWNAFGGYYRARTSG